MIEIDFQFLYTYSSDTNQVFISYPTLFWGEIYGTCILTIVLVFKETVFR